MSDSAVIGRVAVKVTPDTKDFRRDAKKQLKEATADLIVKIGVEFDDSLLKVKADEVKKKLEDKLDDVKAQVKTDVDDIAAKKTEIRLGLITRKRIADISPEVNKVAAAKATAALGALSGSRALKDLGSDFNEFIGNLDRSVPKFAVVTTAASNLSSGILASTSNLLAFSGSLATVFEAGLAIPGILGGIAIGAGATVAVFKDFNKELPEVSTKLHNLQNQMSEKFWAIAKKPIRDFINNIFPEFSRGIERVSTGLGGFFKALANSGRGGFNGELSGMFADLDKSIQISAKHTDAFVGIIQKLGSLGASELPGLAQSFGNIAKSFNNWLGRNQATGQLQSFVDTGVSALKDLGNVIRFTSSAITGLAHAAEQAGGGSLATFAATMKSVANTINGNQFQTALSSAFEGAHDAMHEIATQTGPQFKSFILRLADVLSESLPVAGHAAGKALGAIFGALDTRDVQNTLLGTFQALDRSIAKLAPAMKPLVTALAAILRAADQLVESIAGSLAPSLQILAPKVTSLANSLTPLIKDLGDITKVVLAFASTIAVHIPNVAIITVAAMLAISKITDVVSKNFIKLKTNAASMTAGVRAGAPTLKQFSQYLEFMGQSSANASTKTLAARQAVYGFGRSIGPAIGQAVALIAVTSGLADKMGLTNTISLGFAGSLAGKYGTAIGAAVGLTLDLSKSVHRADASIAALNSTFQDGVTDFKSFDNSLNTIGDSLDERISKINGSESLSLGNVFHDGVLNGDNWDKLFHSITGGQTALQKATAQFQTLAAAEAGVENSLGNIGIALGGVNRQFSATDLQGIATRIQPALDALHLTIDQIGQMDGDHQRAAVASIQTFLAEMDSGSGRAAALADAVKNLNTETLSASDAANAFATALNNVLSPSLDAEQATDQWRQSIKDLRTELSNKAGFTGLSAVASSNREASRQYVQDVQAMLTAKAAAGASSQKIAALLEQSRQAFIREGVAAGLSRTQIVARANAIGLTPKLIRTVFEAAGLDENGKKVDGLKNKIDGLSKDKPKLGFFDSLKAAVPTALANVGKVAGVITRVISQSGGKVSLQTLIGRIGSELTRAGNRGNGDAKAAGGHVGTGFVKGIEAQIGPAAAAAARMAAAAVKAARAALDINSPSRVFQKIGQFVSAGFAKGIIDGQGNVTGNIDKLINALKSHGDKGLAKYAEGQKKRLQDLAKQWDALKSKIDTVKSYIDQIASNIEATGSPTAVNGGSFSDIVENLQNATKDAQAFNDALKQLKGLKLNKTTMDQLAQAGPAAALAAAQAIAASGQAGVDQINQLQGQLNTAASSVGNTAADVFYASGGQIVDGLLAGLIANQGKLEAQMKKIAQAMVRTIKKQLGIHSPSRVFKEIGGYVGRGFIEGVADTHADADKAVARLGANPSVSGSRSGVAVGGNSVQTTNKTFIYNAASGNSISAEEELFAALKRPRGGF